MELISYSAVMGVAVHFCSDQRTSMLNGKSMYRQKRQTHETFSVLPTSKFLACSQILTLCRVWSDLDSWSDTEIHLDCLIPNHFAAWPLEHILIPVAGVSTVGIMVSPWPPHGWKNAHRSCVRVRCVHTTHCPVRIYIYIYSSRELFPIPIPARPVT